MMHFCIILNESVVEFLAKTKNNRSQKTDCAALIVTQRLVKSVRFQNHLIDQSQPNGSAQAIESPHE